MEPHDTLDAMSVQPDDPVKKAPSVDAPEVSESEKAAVKEWVKRIKAAKVFHEKAFNRMKKCQKIATDGHDDEWPASNYVVPVIKRHINVSVASLYARNPTATAKRKKKVEFKLWDGNFASLQQAMQSIQAAMAPPPAPAPMGHNGGPPLDPNAPPAAAPMPPDPNAIALLQEVQDVHNANVQMDRAAKTLEILFEYFMNEQDAGYKQQLKAAVRRTKVCGVSWVKLGFQRLMEPNPDVAARIEDVTSKIATLTRLTADFQAGEITEQDPELDELQRLLAELQAAPELIVREGPVLGFPRANKVIVDPACSHLKTLAGAGWAAHEFTSMTRAAIKETYQVDIGSNFTAYEADKKGKDADSSEQLACVWEVQNKKTQEVFTICEGYPAYLKAPAAPDVKVSRFWTLFPLVFNEIENDDEIYPSSDVWDARYMQREFNNVRQGLREHRIQNKPKYATVKGKLEDADLEKFKNAESGAIIELLALTAGEKVGDILQPIQTVNIDPNLYEVESIFRDIERVIGSSQADLGSPASVTATQSSIVENGRSTMNSDNVDDLDDVLSEVARAMGELMLLELDIATVTEIAGPGAVWPQQPPTRAQIAKDLWLEVKAGSSGRPNRGAELANMERGLPYLIQIPGVNPFPLGRRYGELLELDVDDIVIEGMPSIVAQNAAAGRDPFAAGGNMASPAAQAGAGQGTAGALNAPNPVSNEPGPQAAHPAPMVTGQHSAVPAPQYQAQRIPIGPQPTH